MEAERRCVKCKQVRLRSQYGQRVNRQFRRTCDVCVQEAANLITCNHCETPRPPREFNEYRLLRGIHTCRHCMPSSPGRRSERERFPDSIYPCQVCLRSLPPDWFDINHRPNGKSYVRGTCRRCLQEKRQPRDDLDEQERSLRASILYDFDLARNMFGFDYQETIEWLLAGYKRHKLDEMRLEEWGVTRNRRALWEPDYTSSTEQAED